ncbi:MAG TPA: hemerythrin domain-containing protein [Candidatus Kapabacteria bacterium]|nr:hemerythrin domain-containing protein [Candidatus Kapabacteria bacterium]
MEDNEPRVRPLSGILALHDDERRLIFLYIQQLRHALDSINAQGFLALAFDEIASAVHFLEYELLLHINNQDNVFFPAIEQYMTNLILVLKNEHRELSDIVHKLSVCVENIENGNIFNTTIQELCSHTGTIIGVLESHLQKEESSLFPHICKYLSDEQCEEILRAFTPKNKHTVMHFSNTLHNASL